MAPRIELENQHRSPISKPGRKNSKLSWRHLADAAGSRSFYEFGEHKRKYCCTCAPPSSSAGARGPIFCLFSSDPEDGIYGQVPNKCYAKVKHTKFRFELPGKEVYISRGADPNTTSTWKDMTKRMEKELEEEGGFRNGEVSGYVKGLNVK
jgi:hypothetical protein